MFDNDIRSSKIAVDSFKTIALILKDTSHLLTKTDKATYQVNSEIIHAHVNNVLSILKNNFHSLNVNAEIVPLTNILKLFQHPEKFDFVKTYDCIQYLKANLNDCTNINQTFLNNIHVPKN